MTRGIERWRTRERQRPRHTEPHRKPVDRERWTKPGSGARAHAAQHRARFYERFWQSTAYRKLHLLVGFAVSLLLLVVAANLPIYGSPSAPELRIAEINPPLMLPLLREVPVPVSPEAPDLEGGKNDRTPPEAEQPSAATRVETAAAPEPKQHAERVLAEEEWAGLRHPVAAMALAPVPGLSELTKVTTLRPDWMSQHTYMQEAVQVAPALRGNRELVIDYPDVARRYGIEGRLIVAFTVEMDGTTTEVRVIAPSDPLLNAEAVRALEKARFIPGRQNGKTVRVQMKLAIRFRLD